MSGRFEVVSTNLTLLLYSTLRRADSRSPVNYLKGVSTGDF